MILGKRLVVSVQEADDSPKSFTKWGELAGSASAQLTDLFPVIQKLPKALGPNVRYAEWLHQKEKELYVGLWMRAKRGLEDGTGHV